MANEPERLSVKLASAKGGALLWIAHRADRGQPVTRERFAEEFRGPLWDEAYGTDLLNELTRADLVRVGNDGQLQITAHALEWIDQADFWQQLFATLTGPNPLG